MIHFDTFPIAVCSVVWRLGVWICSKGGGSPSTPEPVASWRGIDFGDGFQDYTDAFPATTTSWGPVLQRLRGTNLL